MFANVRIVFGVTVTDAADRRQDLARRAIAALKSVMLDEGLLHRMQFAAVGDAFDGGHIVTLRGHGKRQTGQHAPPVEENRTSAALAVVAAFFGAGQSKT